MEYFIVIYAESGEKSEVKHFSNPTEVIDRVSKYVSAGIKHCVYEAKMTTDNS